MIGTSLVYAHTSRLSLAVVLPRTHCWSNWHLLPSMTPKVSPKAPLFRKFGCISSREILSQGKDFAHILIEFRELPIHPACTCHSGWQPSPRANWQLTCLPQFGINCRLMQMQLMLLSEKTRHRFCNKRQIYFKILDFIFFTCCILESVNCSLHILCTEYAVSVFWWEKVNMHRQQAKGEAG